MKKMFLINVLCLSLFPMISHADRTMGEKIEVKAKQATRVVKKGAHRIKEKVCMKSDAKCLAEKAKHRAIEAKDEVKDQVSEIKDELD